MNNVNCRNCGTSISAAATACPSCGHPHRTSFNPSLLRWGLAFLVGVGLIGYAASGRHTANSPVQSPAAASPPVAADSPEPIPAKQPGYTLTPNEQALVQMMVADELNIYISGGKGFTYTKDTPPITDALRVSADKLQLDYEQNEVAGDKTYRGRTLAVHGVVTSIDRSVGENYFVSLGGGTNPFMSPRAQMADGYTEYLAALHKGQAITLVCQGEGMLLGSASLSKCVPSGDWSESQANLYVASMTAKLDAGDNFSQFLVLIAVAITPNLPTNSACLSKPLDIKSCKADINQAKTKLSLASIKAVAAKLNFDLVKLGLQKPQPLVMKPSN